MIIWKESREVLKSENFKAIVGIEKYRENKEKYTFCVNSFIATYFIFN